MGRWRQGEPIYSAGEPGGRGSRWVELVVVIVEGDVLGEVILGGRAGRVEMDERPRVFLGGVHGDEDG